MSRYTKFLIALFGGVGAWGVTAGADANYTHVELWGLGAVLATALAVYEFPNTPPDGESSDPSISERDY